MICRLFKRAPFRSVTPGTNSARHMVVQAGFDCNSNLTNMCSGKKGGVRGKKRKNVAAALAQLAAEAAKPAKVKVGALRQYRLLNM